MDFEYAYENGYKQAAPKVLSNDEKAFLQGFNAAVDEVKCALLNYEGELLEEPKLIRKLKMESAVFFCSFLDNYIASAFEEHLISFADERLAAHNKTCEDWNEKAETNPDWKWNVENAEVPEPDTIVEDEDSFVDDEE